jgi:hypothetical protein
MELNHNNLEQYHQIHAYRSDDESLNHKHAQDNPATTAKPDQKRRKREWLIKKVYENGIVAKDELNNEKIWSYLASNEPIEGVKHEYRCNLVKRRVPQCNAGVCLLYHNDNLKVTKLKTVDDHNHDEINSTQKRTGLTQATKEAIARIHKMGIGQLRLIMSNLKDEQKIMIKFKCQQKNSYTIICKPFLESKVLRF